MLRGGVDDPLRCLGSLDAEYPLESLALLVVRDLSKLDLSVSLLPLLLLEDGQQLVVVLLPDGLDPLDGLVSAHVVDGWHPDHPRRLREWLTPQSLL